MQSSPHFRHQAETCLRLAASCTDQSLANSFQATAENFIAKAAAVEEAVDLELVETFLGQTDRYTHSNLKLSEAFSRVAFGLAFEYGSNLQKCAVRQALKACVSLPTISPQSSTPVRHVTFEKHLSNLLVHVLKTIADDGAIPGYDRDIARLLVEIRLGQLYAPKLERVDDYHAPVETTVFQLEQQLRKAPSAANSADAADDRAPMASLPCWLKRVDAADDLAPIASR